MSVDELYFTEGVMLRREALLSSVIYSINYQPFCIEVAVHGDNYYNFSITKIDKNELSPYTSNAKYRAVRSRHVGMEKSSIFKLCHLFARTTRRDVYTAFDALLMPVYIDHLRGRCTRA
jgi:hypothetical protein